MVNRRLKSITEIPFYATEVLLAYLLCQRWKSDFNQPIYFFWFSWELQNKKSAKTLFGTLQTLRLWEWKLHWQFSGIFVFNFQKSHSY